MAIISNEDMVKTLSTIYNEVKKGIPNVVPPVEKMADDYLSKFKNKETAAQFMLNNQIVKCTTSGFLTGFGGLITLPVTVPLNVGSVLYVQMRMIACAAYMAGYDLNDDQVQTFVYACLAGVSMNQVIKRFGIKLGEKLALQGVKKIPGKVLIKINQRIGFRLVTKFGQKGFVNIGKMIPFVGAVVGGGFDLVETKIIADQAYKNFIEGDFSVGEKDNLIDTDSDDK